MINHILPGLHNVQAENLRILEQYTGYSLITEFISDTTQFYKKYFNELNNSLSREKRSLVFETPNRVKICHEYDLFQKKKYIIKDNTPYFIINPTVRLAWLKIFCDGERITIARADVIKNITINKLQSEIDNYCNSKAKNKNDVIDEIWSAKNGLPCFVIFSQKPKQSFMIEMQFYETVVLKGNKKFEGSLINPIQPRNISYDYIPLSRQTSWIYLQSPKNFEVELFENNTNRGLGSDPEVVSYAFTDKQAHNFNLKIKIAKTLNIWYLSVYYAAISLTLLLLSINLNILWIKLNFPSFNFAGIETLLPKEALITIATLISAAIITTRSFMITEETILKKYSMLISVFLVLIIFSTILMEILCHI